jgi:hypothetical protein
VERLVKEMLFDAGKQVKVLDAPHSCPEGGLTTVSSAYPCKLDPFEKLTLKPALFLLTLTRTYQCVGATMRPAYMKLVAQD